MEERTLRVLEYDRIREDLARYAQTEMGRERARSLVPSPDPAEVQRNSQETEEAYRWIQVEGGTSFEGVRDIRKSVARAARGGGLGAEDLWAVAEAIRAGRRARRSLEKLRERQAIPVLGPLADGIPELRELEAEIRQSVDENGRVLDGASPELAEIRRKQRSLSLRIREALEEMIRNPNTQKFLQEPIITVRDGRYCVPVKSAFRSSFGGIVHDQSASGQTVFVEPAAVVPLGNRLRELEVAEEKEVERILRRLSGRVGEEADRLAAMTEAIGKLDFALGKARMAVDMRAEPPEFVEGARLNLKRCRHPFIPPDRVVPIDIRLGDEYHVLVITGPNTGGKTVALKTAGLLVCMAQSGLFIPAEPGSQLSVFEQVFADIGDEQSIEQNLSTFSGHMKNIVAMLNRVNERTLVLLDEIGAGTDPAEGSALAAAILEFLLSRGVRTIATTHYGDLKAFAFTRKGAMNASVEFDSESLRPTYRLLIGIPGRSNALAIAERLGLRRDVLEAARKQLRTDEVRVEDMIRQLEISRRQAEEDRKRAEEARREAERLRDEWLREQREWQRMKEERTARAEEEARRIVGRAEREVEAVMRELRKMMQEDRERLKEHRLADLKRRLDETRPAVRFGRPAAGNGTPGGAVTAGDEVEVASFQQKGTVLEVHGDQALVQIGSMKIRMPVAQLSKRSGGAPKVIPSPVAVRKETAGVGLELDLRGMTVEEALPEIDKYLDRAVLAGLRQVHLIHGKGTGALRSGVQEFLRTHPHVRAYRNGGPGEGGLGVTVVELK